MTGEIGDMLVIPYGTRAVPAATLAALAEGRLDALNLPGAPTAVIDPAAGEPLRLHAVEPPFTRPPVAQDLARAGAQVAFLEAHLIELCGAWAKPRRAFVEAYFAAARAKVRAEKTSLSQRLGPLEGLCELDHWVFSALAPMPAAHLRVGAGPTAGGAHAPDDFVEVDAAFWDGAGLVAVVVAAGGVRPSRMRALDRVDATGVRLVRLDTAELASGDPAGLLDALGGSFTTFLEGERLPDSPFRGRGLAHALPA